MPTRRPGRASAGRRRAPTGRRRGERAPAVGRSRPRSASGRRRRAPARSARRRRPPRRCPSPRSASTSASESRHRRLAVLLVQPVARWRRSSSSGWPASAATSSAARPALAAASACGTVVGQQAAGDLGRHRRRRHEQRPRAIARVDASARPRGTARRPRTAIVEAAVAGRRDVVGVALELGGEVEQRRRRRAAVGAAGDQRRGPGTTPADDRGRRRAEAAGVRDPLWQRSRRPGGCAPIAVERRAHRADHEVALVAAARRRRPRPSTSTARPVVGDLGARARRAGRGRGRAQSKPGPEVGAGRRDRDTVTGPVDEAWSRSAPGRPRPPPRRRRRRRRCRRGRVNVDSAVSMSLSPWPVTVTDDRAGRRTTRPRSRSASSPATPAADAGSTKTPSRRGELALGGEDLVVGDRAGTGRRTRRAAATASCHEAGLPIRIAVAMVSGSATGSPVHQRRGALRPGSRASAGSRVARPSVGVLAVAQPVRRDVAGVADRQHVHVGGVAEEVDDLERRGLLALEPHRVDRVDQRDRVVARPARGRAAGSRRSCRAP